MSGHFDLWCGVNRPEPGVPEKIAMQISGHKTRAIFNRYNIVSERDLTDAAQKMERFLSAPVEPASGTATDEVKGEFPVGMRDAV